MGYTPANIIKKGAEYLLAILREKSPVRYSRFYDGTDETTHRLAMAMGLERGDEEWYCVAHIIDLAVFELSEQGVVESSELNEKLADGENDYLIKLTEEGRKSGPGFAELEFWPAE